MEDNSNLELNADAIRERSGIRSSLTDMNEIPVFTNSFQEKKEQTGIAQAAEEAELSAIIFDSQPAAVQSDDLIGHLFLTGSESLVIRNDTASDVELATYRVGTLLMFAAAFAAGIILFKRRGSKKNDVNNQPARAI